ncbi:hypothetical protein MPSEU_000268100 [Mayamaea pseudoterrestris]|nr:hypothetical protein MPSEU_000268100 [Mayamaea pseudoterrestris]
MSEYANDQQHHQDSSKDDSLFFMPPPFPGRGGEQQQQHHFSIEAAALQLQDFEHTFATPLAVQQIYHEKQNLEAEDRPNLDADSLTASFITPQQQQQQQQNTSPSPSLPPPDPLAAAVRTSQEFVNENFGVVNNPLATLVAASSLEPNSNNFNAAATKTKRSNTPKQPRKKAVSTPMTPAEENHLLKKQLAQREREIQSLRQQLVKTTATHAGQQPFAVTNSTATLVGDAVLAFASSSEKPVNPNDVKNLQERWKARFQQLIRYKLQHGHASPSKADDGPLHAWVRKQRTNKQLRDRTHGEKGLSDDQVNALNSIGFEWIVGVGKRPHVKHDQWQANYDKLMQYRTDHGCIPNCCNDKALNKWMQNQRARKKLLQDHGPTKAKGMTWERVQRLELLGFKWSTKDRNR